MDVVNALAFGFNDPVKFNVEALKRIRIANFWPNIIPAFLGREIWLTNWQIVLKLRKFQEWFISTFSFDLAWGTFF